jgi:hypothetical protein
VSVIVGASDTSPRWRSSLMVSGLSARGAVLDDGRNFWVVLRSQMRVSLALTGACPQRHGFGCQPAPTGSGRPDFEIEIADRYQHSVDQVNS